MRRYGKTGGNGAGFWNGEKEETVGGCRKKKEKKRKCSFLWVSFRRSFSFLPLKIPDSKCWGTMGWLAQSERAVRDCGYAAAPLTAVFLSSHISLISNLRPLRNQLGRLAARSFVPMWQSERERESVHNLYAITWHYKPSLCVLFVALSHHFCPPAWFAAANMCSRRRTWPPLTSRQGVFLNSCGGNNTLN